MGSVVPYTDNFYAALNSAVFSDGSFCYIPKGVRCPMELSTYFRINEAGTGQFERTLIICEDGGYVSYLEGCTAPMRDENQLHAAVVEIVAKEDAEVKYSTIQNWYPGIGRGQGRRLQLRHQARHLRRAPLQDLLDPARNGLGHHVEVPLRASSRATTPSASSTRVAFTKGHQQADTGTKMIHLGKRHEVDDHLEGHLRRRTPTTRTAASSSVNKKAEGARNFSQCDSLLLGDQCGAHTFPYIEINNSTAKVEHEATTSKVGEDQMFYCQQRGISEQDALNLIVNGFAKEILAKLPMEFAVEAQKLLSIQLEGSVG